MRTLALQLGLLTLLAIQSGCGLLIGNVKPVEQHSEQYGYLDLSKEDSSWKRLEQPGPGKNAENGSELPDVAFQSEKTASVISLNSACRPSIATSEKDLRGFTDQLLLGIAQLKFRNERTLDVQGAPALETTVQGKLNGETITLRTVVLRRRSCIYDLTYVSRPDRFKTDEETFSHFVASVRLK